MTGRSASARTSSACARPHTAARRSSPYSLTVRPADHFINWQQDPSGNHLARCVFPTPTEELAIIVDLVADLTAINPFDFFIDESAARWPFDYDPGLRHDLEPYLAVTTEGGGSRLEAWVAAIGRTPTPLIQFLVALNRRVRDDVDYAVRIEHGVHSPQETLAAGVGSCRDSAWLLVGILRRLGIAARFASGYLVQLVPDPAPAAAGPAPTGGPTSDFTDLHAWAEAYVPGAGWVGLDATSGLLAGEGHIPLACTSAPAAAAPVEGATGRAETAFAYANHVRRFADDEARVTLPYTPHEWARVEELGRSVDAALIAVDVRLTMGGEPTFVAVGAGGVPEWSTAADGPTKRRLATALAGRLADRLAPGALLQRPGQVVSGRTPPPLADRRQLADRRPPALGRPGAASRPDRPGSGHRRRRARPRPGDRRRARPPRRRLRPRLRGPGRAPVDRGPPARRRPAARPGRRAAGRRAGRRGPTGRRDRRPRRRARRAGGDRDPAPPRRR